MGSYLFYSQAMELGYETAINNAAYLLDHRLVDPWAILGIEAKSQPLTSATTTTTITEELRADDASTCPTPGPELSSSLVMLMNAGSEWKEGVGHELRYRLALRCHWLGLEIGSNKNSYLPLGDAYFYGRGGKSKGRSWC